MGPHATWLTLCISIAMSFGHAASAGGISTDCGEGKECLVEVPGAVCADGKPAFYTLMMRPGAKNLLIYVAGRGVLEPKSPVRSV